MITRDLRLTPELVARVPPHSGDTGRLAGRSDLTTDADIAQTAAALLANRPDSGEVWIFAYGSLIWAPEFDYVEERLATVRVWPPCAAGHRARLAPLVLSGLGAALSRHPRTPRHHAGA